MREEDESAREAEAGVTLPTAPLMVIRDIGTRFPAPLKKTRRPTTVRIIDEGLLDEKTARELAAAFPQSGYNSVLLPEIAELDWKDEYRDGLPFLHSVCCVHVIADRRDMAQTMLHRRIFERVKLALGTLLLDYPLSLDEIQGILMCTDSFRVGAGDGKEFIDSWMLTGYCAKQAMLCIEFDRIARETRQGKSGAANVRAIRLWATICLHHLHWTAASGRPSTITESYLNYCPLLLNFYDASVQDGILLAELFLYSILPTVLEKPPQLDVDGDCNEFAAWRHEWRHLLALPAAALLKMGYASACLLLVVRGLEHQGEQLGPAAFLSRHSSPTTDDEKQQQQLVQQQQIVNLRRAAAKHAHALLQTFLGMPDTLQDSVSSNRCLCLTYGALVLAHYDESQSSLSDMDNLRLVRRLHEWFSNSPSKVVLARFTNLCEHIIVGRLERARTRGPAKVGGTGVPDGRYQGKDGTGLAMAHGVGYNYGPLPDGRQVVASHASSGAALTVDGVPVIATFATSAEGVFNADPDAQEIAGLFDMLPSINLEDFFAGGYLEM
ncbi:uncharacterized protein B0I36DRAFT_136429 [Microdochium trichocladiopsis]|uniref:Transcription factor domain-containing protein n=1 Tax=Microdochium trichocladiopsis TaxID=1682393 RepID=A0A9P8Y422_9PEZI|nr:uncharacterized protein B0I36DRAFT_136429 [Microdochium trichocladiopsis]KAH7027215.1 hypothetical protein B0I36DRAFT_136429 [Microdochium trichocladiopsis]